MKHNFNMSEHVWTFAQMESYIASSSGPSIVSLVIEPNIKDVARFVFESGRDHIVHRKGKRRRKKSLINCFFLRLESNYWVGLYAR